jgi:hypothetical protein
VAGAIGFPPSQRRPALPEDINARIEALTDHLFAVQLMLLSHIVATGDLVPDSLENTLAHAKVQRDGAIEAGRHRIAIRLDMMSEPLMRHITGAAND